MISNNIQIINNNIIKYSTSSLFNKNIKIIAVSKGINESKIIEAIKNNITNFGENYLQEAEEKWINLKKIYPFIKLHFIGKIQTNKLVKILNLFDYIHTIDNIKTADKILSILTKNPAYKEKKFFIQINYTPYKNNKNGISIENINNLIEYCKIIKLPINGLMCMSNNGIDDFKKTYELSKIYNLQNLSMGMSDDYIEAIKNGSTYLRIGKKIFQEN